MNTRLRSRRSAGGHLGTTWGLGHHPGRGDPRSCRAQAGRQQTHEDADGDDKDYHRQAGRRPVDDGDNACHVDGATLAAKGPVSRLVVALRRCAVRENFAMFP